MSYQNSSSFRERNINREEDTYFKESQTYSLDNTNEDAHDANSLLKVEVNIGNGKIKELIIISTDGIDQTISNFCSENNLPKEAKIPIKNLILEKLDKKITQCKPFFI